MNTPHHAKLSAIGEKLIAIRNDIDTLRQTAQDENIPFDYMQIRVRAAEYSERLDTELKELEALYDLCQDKDILEIIGMCHHMAQGLQRILFIIPTN